MNLRLAEEENVSSPQHMAAEQFMAHKGLPHARPFDVEKVDDEPCWYFYYELPEGVLELEVYWNGDEWETIVYTFNVAQ